LINSEVRSLDMSEPKKSIWKRGLDFLWKLDSTIPKRIGLSPPRKRFRAKVSFKEDPELERCAIELGRDPSFLRDYAMKWGNEAAFRFADEIAKDQENFRIWFPQLVKFSEACRKASPIPHEDELSPVEIGIRNIIAQKINELEREAPTSLSHHALICELPIVTFPVAVNLWPGKVGAVLLTSRELAQWRKRIVGKFDELSFSEYYSWRVRKISIDYEWYVNRGRTKSLRNLGLVETAQPYLFGSGFLWGELDAQWNDEIWTWDGREFSFVTTNGTLYHHYE